MEIRITINTALGLTNDMMKNIKTVTNRIGKLLERRLKNRVRKFSDTGRMLNSIELIVKAKSTDIIIDVPYAKIQNEGGKIEITNDMRRKMWALYGTTGNEMYKRIAITKQSHIVIKAKNYIDDVVDVKDIERQILKHILK